MFSHVGNLECSPEATFFHLHQADWLEIVQKVVGTLFFHVFLWILIVFSVRYHVDPYPSPHPALASRQKDIYLHTDDINMPATSVGLM